MTDIELAAMIDTLDEIATELRGFLATIEARRDRLIALVPRSPATPAVP